ncbi:hypothetical protein KEM48_010237, partial [Puccinia striiformis f. sp. tritici PST-130]
MSVNQIPVLADEQSSCRFNTEDKDNSDSEEEDDEANGPKHKEGELAKGDELSLDNIQDLEEEDDKDAYTSVGILLLRIALKRGEHP